MKDGKLKVVLAGLGFGGSFAPIWLAHPDVYSVGFCEPDQTKLKKFTDAYPAAEVYASIEDALADDDVDAVHLVTPIPDHARQTVQVLEAGKHCACTVPMATSLDDIRSIFAAVRKSGKNYMMMETTLYTYHYFYIRHMIDSGELGRVQFVRGSHYQDMENWPDYWTGLPPFWYGTHAIAPLVCISGSRVERVSCLGSGTMRPELTRKYGNPYPVETTHLKFANGLAGEATRSLFETARRYQEGLFVYGSKKSFEWGFSDGKPPFIETLEPNSEGSRGMNVSAEAIDLPNFYEDLPEPLWKYTVGKNYDNTNPQDSLRKGAGAGHHGAHAHMVNEFARSILDGRRAWTDEVLAANITAAGICSHESAMRDGEWVTVPTF